MTKAERQARILAAVAADPVLGPLLTSTSAVADFRLWASVMADAQGDTQDGFDMHTAEVSAIIATQKPHRLQWYVTKLKAFQYGDTLPADTDVYSTVKPITDASRVVTFGAAVEFSNLIRLKSAKGSVGALAALSGPQLTALTAYMNRIKDAGVRLRVTSGSADNLQSKVNVYFDPLVLDATGARLDGTAATPVKDAINGYLNSLPFNGVFDFYDYVKAIRAVDGVKVAEPLVCQANYAATPYFDIMGATPNEYTPDAGYMALDVAYFDANVNYQAL